jgi:hypothetical protein
MALQVVLTVAAVTTGQGDAETPSLQTINSNAPPKNAAGLLAGNNTIQVPSGYTVGSCWIKPPLNSANAKTVKAIPADTGSATFTNQPIIYPVAPGGTFIINSAGPETVELIFLQ